MEANARLLQHAQGDRRDGRVSPATVAHAQLSPGLWSVSTSGTSCLEGVNELVCHLPRRALVTTLGQRGVNLVRSAEQRRALQAAAQQVQNKALSGECLHRRSRYKDCRDQMFTSTFKSSGELRVGAWGLTQTPRPPLAPTAAILQGCAFHNASLSAEDRFLVEDLFLKQHVLILCSTCTLAMGVNLPAHLVVIKGTKQWSADRHDYEDYDTSMILQMAGRAGRPDFDTQGFCEVLTGEGDAATVRGRVRGAEVLESHLRGGLCEALNSEVVLGTVGTVEDAVRWFKLTFCYIRMRKHPRHYRVPDKAANSPDALEEFLTTMILNRVQEVRRMAWAKLTRQALDCARL